MSRRIATKGEDAPFKVLIENELRHLQKLLTPASLRQQGDAIKDFRLGDRSREELMPWLGFKPRYDGFVRFLPQDFRNDIGVEDEHESLYVDLPQRLAGRDSEIDAAQGLNPSTDGFIQGSRGARIRR